jgi:hypothetical protein
MFRGEAADETKVHWYRLCWRAVMFRSASHLSVVMPGNAVNFAQTALTCLRRAL